MNSVEEQSKTRRAIVPHQGMPPLENVIKPLSFFEFWPMWLFYTPLFVYIGFLMLRYRGIGLPLLSNPAFPASGLVGESKAEILTLAQARLPQWVAPFLVITRNDARQQPLEKQCTTALEQIKSAGLSLPLVAKPDLGCRGAGVRLVQTPEALEAYLAAFPAGHKFLLQKYIDYEAEAGVFYVRKPGARQGQILSLTLKYFPHVVGDGVSTLRALIMADPRARALANLYLPRHQEQLDTIPARGEAIRLAFAGSHSRGAIFRDGAAYITPQMVQRFDAIAQTLPDFYFGRFDIRFSDYQTLQRGEGFVILEINGAGAEATHIWDCRKSLSEAYQALAKQYRLLFEIGADNRTRGFKRESVWQLWQRYRQEKALVRLYPPTQ